MGDSLDGLIREADVAWASELMGFGPNGFAPIDGDDSRLRAMLDLKSTDYEACPGSGKTTLLVAKLAVLAKRWPHARQGICVLSHTNAARDEISDRLGASASGAALLRYPHFIGTIHSFVNEYLAIPWLRSKGIPVCRIDTKSVLERRWHSLDRKWRYSLEKRKLGEYSLEYDAPDYTGDSTKRNLGRQTKLYEELVKQGRISSEEGYFCFDEMFVWAKEALDKLPEAAPNLRQRFPLLFIDEAQDNSEEQSNLLHRVFCSEGESSIRQRFGDSNQAIYSHVGQAGAKTDSFPGEEKQDIPRSYRFSQTIADVVAGLGVVPQALVGAGPTMAPIVGAGKQPTLFLFDDNSVTEVISQYGKHLLEQFSDNELAAGTFSAIAGVHKLSEDTQIPRAVGHYAPFYDPKNARDLAGQESFFRYLATAGVAMAKHRNSHVLVNALAAALQRAAELTGCDSHSYGRKSPHKWVVAQLEGTGNHVGYLELIELTLQFQGQFDFQHWACEVLPRAQAVISELAETSTLTAESQEFLSWPSAERNESLEQRSDNVFRYPLKGTKVEIQLGSIHSVKGETHTATLVLDSYFHKHHLSVLKPWLLGTRFGGRKLKGAGFEGSRLLLRLRLHYVAMTRPSHLLCLAMRRDAWGAGELDALREIGWNIIDCPSSVEGVTRTV